MKMVLFPSSLGNNVKSHSVRPLLCNRATDVHNIADCLQPEDENSTDFLNAVILINSDAAEGPK
jgi:hypothetical protein